MEEAIRQLQAAHETEQATRSAWLENYDTAETSRKEWVKAKQDLDTAFTKLRIAQLAPAQ